MATSGHLVNGTDVLVTTSRGLELSLHSQPLPEQAGNPRDRPPLVPQLLGSRSLPEPTAPQPGSGQGLGKSGNRSRSSFFLFFPCFYFY